MRMKDDYMKNGQLKPGYNLQISSNNQYILNYSLGQTTADTSLLKKHIAEFIAQYQQTPDTLTADAGYGSEENYQDLEEKSIEAFVKYPYFHKEQKSKKHRENPFIADNLFYNEQDDYYVCPMGQQMNQINNYEQKTKSGFTQTITKYQAKNCDGCPLRGSCHKSKNDRILSINHKLIKHKEKARTLLTSEKGIQHRKQRCWDVEAIFGNWKHNKNYKRFLLRGMEKVKVETGLMAIAHNLHKYTLKMA